MAEILHQLTIAAPPEKVYKAITEEQAYWWTPEADARTQVGAVSEFTFPSGFVIKLETTQLEPGRQVQYLVKKAIPDWSGTRVTWEMTPVAKGTKVLFGHRDFASVTDSLASASFTWAWYLNSLKDYLETGKGRPGQAPV